MQVDEPGAEEKTPSVDLLVGGGRDSRLHDLDQARRHADRTRERRAVAGCDGHITDEQVEHHAVTNGPPERGRGGCHSEAGEPEHDPESP